MVWVKAFGKVFSYALMEAVYCQILYCSLTNFWKINWYFLSVSLFIDLNDFQDKKLCCKLRRFLLFCQVSNQEVKVLWIFILFLFSKNVKHVCRHGFSKLKLVKNKWSCHFIINNSWRRAKYFIPLILFIKERNEIRPYYPYFRI